MLLPAAAAGQGTEIVRGRVTGVDKKPIADVTVTITGLSTQAVLTARTTDKGIFTALFPNAEGDYLISFRKIGFSPYNTRLTRTGLTSVLVADVTLRELVFELDTITVAAQRLSPRATRRRSAVSNRISSPARSFRSIRPTCWRSPGRFPASSRSATAAFRSWAPA